MVKFPRYSNALDCLYVHLGLFRGNHAPLSGCAPGSTRIPLRGSGIDGAKLLRRLWHVTLPEIRGVMIILLVLQIIGTMQVFVEPFVMTKGGPANATLTVIMLVYRYGFEYRNFGIAGALGVLMFLVLVFFSLVYLRVSRRGRK
jgi:ABC-type sugar transport system permease subunit